MSGFTSYLILLWSREKKYIEHNLVRVGLVPALTNTGQGRPMSASFTTTLYPSARSLTCIILPYLPYPCPWPGLPISTPPLYLLWVIFLSSTPILSYPGLSFQLFLVIATSIPLFPYACTSITSQIQFHVLNYIANTVSQQDTVPTTSLSDTANTMRYHYNIIQHCKYYTLSPYATQSNITHQKNQLYKTICMTFRCVGQQYRLYHAPSVARKTKVVSCFPSEFRQLFPPLRWSFVRTFRPF